MSDERIKGGFYLKARKAQEGWIANAPPHVREIWDYLLHHANYKDHGKIKRGQLLTTYRDIMDGLAWYVGYRKMRYSKTQCDNAMRSLRKQEMITTTKTTRGTIVTILKYEKYQDPKNYEGYNDYDNESDNATTTPSNDKERKGNKEKKGKGIMSGDPPKDGGKPDRIPYSEIVSYLNEKVGSSFSPRAKATRGHIKARFNEGFTLQNFKDVIDFKAGQWKTDAKMVEYLRPATLFCTKFEGYLQAAGGSAIKPDCKICWYNRNLPKYPCKLTVQKGFDVTTCKNYKPME